MFVCSNHFLSFISAIKIGEPHLLKELNEHSFHLTNFTIYWNDYNFSQTLKFFHFCFLSTLSKFKFQILNFIYTKNACSTNVRHMTWPKEFSYLLSIFATLETLVMTNGSICPIIPFWLSICGIKAKIFPKIIFQIR